MKKELEYLPLALVSPLTFSPLPSGRLTTSPGLASHPALTAVRARHAEFAALGFSGADEPAGNMAARRRRD